MLGIQYVKVGDINDKTYIYIYDIKCHACQAMYSIHNSMSHYQVSLDKMCLWKKSPGLKHLGFAPMIIGVNPAEPAGFAVVFLPQKGTTRQISIDILFTKLGNNLSATKPFMKFRLYYLSGS